MKTIMLVLLLFILTVGCLETAEVEERQTTFTITPSAVITSGYNSCTVYNLNEEKFTVPVEIWNISHTIRSCDNNVWEDPRIQFQITPDKWHGATTNDKETIYFSVKNYDVRINTHQLITKGSEYQITWAFDHDSWYIRGSKDIFVQHEDTLTLDFDVNKLGMSQITIYNSVEMEIEFRNAESTWLQTYNVSFLAVKEYAL